MALRFDRNTDRIGTAYRADGTPVAIYDGNALAIFVREDSTAHGAYLEMFFADTQHWQNCKKDGILETLFADYSRVDLYNTKRAMPLARLMLNAHIPHNIVKQQEDI